jgi:FKBP12-rapamycin complex-associated protein
MAYVSPKLSKAENLVLAVPGTYQAGKPTIHISSINSIVTLISSKQRPRKISLIGSDGKEYKFLLKGKFSFFNR